MTGAESRRAFTLVEMLTTVAALVILLGLMVSLARDVRRRSATELTNEIIARLDGYARLQIGDCFGNIWDFKTNMVWKAALLGASC